MNHGAHENRMYGSYLQDVCKLAQEHGLSAIHEAVYRREDGLLEWKSEYRDVLNAFNDAYFRACNEDGI